MRNPNTDRGAALVTWGFLEVLQRSGAGPVEVLLMARRKPPGVCPGHAHQRCPLAVPASTGLPHRESRLAAPALLWAMLREAAVGRGAAAANRWPTLRPRLAPVTRAWGPVSRAGRRGAARPRPGSRRPGRCRRQACRRGAGSAVRFARR